MPKPDERVLAAGERVEIYRPLIADPKEVRKQRAAKAKAAKATGNKKVKKDVVGKVAQGMLEVMTQVSESTSRPRLRGRPRSHSYKPDKLHQ